MKESVILVGGGLLQKPAVNEVRDLGYHCVVTDANPSCPAQGDRNYALDIYDVEAHLKLASQLSKELKIVSVFTQGHDCEVTVAALAESLGLPGCGVEAALNCKNKARMRWTLDTHFPNYSCRWREATACDHLLWTAPMPCVVKPVDNSGSRGVSIVRTPALLVSGVRKAMNYSSTGTAIIEELLAGPEQTVEILFTPKVQHINITDRFFSFQGDRCIETSISTPTRLSKHDQDSLWDMVTSLAGALGVTQGVFKCDTILTQKGPKVLECTARLSGGYDAQYLQPAALGTNPVRAALLASLGAPVPEDLLTPTRYTPTVCYSVLRPPKRSTYLFRTGLKHVFIRSTSEHPLEDCASRYAFIITSRPTFEEAYSLAKEVEQDICS